MAGNNERIISSKALIDFDSFTILVNDWLEKRLVLKEADSNFASLVFLILGETSEVLEAKQRIGKEYSSKNETGELVDVAFFFVSIIRFISTQYGEEIDHEQALVDANGQIGGSNTFDKLNETAGNLSEKYPSILRKDAQYLLTLIFSYMLHMENPVNPVEVVRKYTIPKNSGNHPEVFLNGTNFLFKRAYSREMNKEERAAHFKHVRKAMRIIRLFIRKHVDPSTEDTGLKPEHYTPYKMFICNFTSGLVAGLTPEGALTMLIKQLHKDHNVPLEKEQILVATR